MNTILTFAIAYLVAATLSGIGIAHLVEHRSVSVRRGVYWVLLIGSLVPLALHYRWTAKFASRWGEPDPVLIMYPNLKVFLLAAPVAALITLIAAIGISIRWPVVTTVVPCLFAAAYHRFLLPIAIQSPAGTVPLDNTPHIWLAVLTASATALLAGYAFTALRSHPR